MRAVAYVAALALLMSGCGLAAGLPDGAEFIPSDSAFVLALNLPALTATDLYKLLEERGGAVGLNRLNFFQFAKATGLDPLRDVRSLTFVGRGRGEEGPELDQLSAIVSGSFDGKKVYDFLKDSGLPFMTHADLDIFQIVIVEGRCRLCVAVLDDATATFGDGETLQAMAEARRDPAAAVTSDPTANRLLTRVDNRAAIWGLARGRRLAGSLGGFLQKMTEQQANLAAFTAIEDISFFVAAGESILVAADAVVGSEEDALLVADILKGAGAMGRMALKQARPEASRFLTSFKVQVDGFVVRASTSFPQSDLVDLADSAMSDMFPVPFQGPFGRGGLPGTLLPSPPGEDTPEH
jgi:hypothetical protein